MQKKRDNATVQNASKDCLLESDSVDFTDCAILQDCTCFALGASCDFEVASTPFVSSGLWSPRFSASPKGFGTEEVYDGRFLMKRSFHRIHNWNPFPVQFYLAVEELENELEDRPGGLSKSGKWLPLQLLRGSHCIVFIAQQSAALGMWTCYQLIELF
eukprot:scaffold1712_cov126-Cylindrotheca_fusiformis.AAC.2